MTPRVVAVADIAREPSPADAAGVTRSDVPHWEYACHHVTSLSMRALESNLPIEDHLNRMGGDAWELVSVVLRRSVTSREEEFVLFFKRPRSADPRSQ
jgi:hypothetical protein